MKNLSSFSAFATLLLFAVPALAQDFDEDADMRTAVPNFTQTERQIAKEDPAYYTIDPSSIRVTLKESRDEDVSPVKLVEPSPKSLDDVLVSVDKIINIASKIWKVIQDNAPVVNIDSKYATAYPAGVTAANQLSGWTRPRSYVYGFYAKNLYGYKAIDVEYKITYTFGGSYKGNGRYLTAVAMVPTKTDVAWGYRLSMNASVPNSTVVNVGTEDAPVAALQLKLLWKMSTVLKESDGTSIYYVQGDGYFEEIARPWKAAPKLENMGSAARLLDTENVFKD